GPTYALVVSTLAVFFATWVLHAYQWFWLRGTVLLAGTDAAFWAVFSVLVAINAHFELHHGPPRLLAPSKRSWPRFTGTGLRIAGTFASIALLWSLWTCESFSQWLALWGALRETKAAHASGWVPVLAIASAVVASDALAQRSGILPPAPGKRHSPIP